MTAFARLAAVAAVLLAALPALAQPALPPPHVRAEGTGEVKVAPDLAVVRLGVTAEAPDARRAQAKAAEAMKKVVAAVKGKGIPAERIVTDRLDLSPVWEQGDGTRRPKVVAYRATNVLKVEVPLGTPPSGARAGEVVDAAIAAGANDVQGIEFTLEDEEPVRLRALREAAEKARARATALADALGLRIGRLLEATESGGGVMPPPPRPYFAKMEMAVADTPVEAGELTVRVSVNVMYEVEGARR